METIVSIARRPGQSYLYCTHESVQTRDSHKQAILVRCRLHMATKAVP
jgi:hypothetical protein